MKRACATVIAFGFLIACLPARAEPGRLESGLALLDEAAARRASDPARAESLAGDAAALIQASLHDVGQDNPAAQRALGNAWLLAGELGHAVLAYRRAEAAAPGDPLVRASLEHARSLVEARPPGADTPGGSWRTAVRAWRGWNARPWMFWGCVGAFAASCVMLALRIVSALPGRVTTPATALSAATLAGLGVLGAGPLAADAGAAVMLTPSVGRTGPHAEIYPPALDRALPAGTEVRVLETRDGWAFCTVGAERVWLPGAAIERVHPETGFTLPGGNHPPTQDSTPAGDAGRIVDPTQGPGQS